MSGDSMLSFNTEDIRKLMGDINDFIFDFIDMGTEQHITIYYIKSLIDQKRLEELIVLPLRQNDNKSITETIGITPISKIASLEQAESKLFQGSVLIEYQGSFWAASAESSLGRSIEPSEAETILYGPRDSFSEQLDQNITLIRRRIPIARLKYEKYTIGTLSKTKTGIMYIQGIANPKLVEIVKQKLQNIDYDIILDSSHISQFLEDDIHSLFPQFQQTDRPDAVAASLASGKIALLVDNTPFVLIAPITFFDLFQSPEDYINRWIIASFFRLLRFFSFFISFTFTPLYVALTMHHYQVIPLQLLYAILSQRSKLPFTPFGEALIMLVALEIIKEASLRMPNKSGQTLGIIGGIVIGQATVEAGIVSNILIIFVSISVLASFLVPNYLMSTTSRFIQLALLVLASTFGIVGITMGILAILIHLNGLSSLKQPYLSPLSPFYGSDLKDIFLRLPLKWMRTRPLYLNPKDKWRYSLRRSEDE